MIKMSVGTRRMAIGLLAGLVGGALISADVEAFPDKPIKMMVPFGAGGITDTAARVTAGELSKTLGVDIVIVNKGGGGGTIGTATASKAKADGYTVLFTPYAPLANQIHLRKVPYDMDSFDYICHTFFAPFVVYVKPGSEYNSLNQLMDAAKAAPGTFSFASPAVGSFPHLAGSYFDSLLGGNVLKHVGGAADSKAAPMLLGGHLSMVFSNPSVPGLKEAKMLASLTPERLPKLPDLPTAKEVGYDVQVGVGGGIVAPKGIPAAAKEKLISGCKMVVESNAYATEMKKLGTPAQFMAGPDYEAFIKDMSVKNGKLFKSMGLEPR